MLSLLAVAGCGRSQRGPVSLAGTTGARLCAKHQVALVTVNGFRQVIFFPDVMYGNPAVDVDEVKARCPNAVPNEQFLINPHGDSASESCRETFAQMRITYCPQCEREAQRIYRTNRLNRMPIVRLPKSFGRRYTVRPDLW